MLKRTILSASFVAALMVTGVATAQDSATLTLRSGEKVSGQLVDLGGVGYTIRVSGSERQIPQRDVAVVDFTGGLNDADWTTFTGSPIVVLRNGQTVNGTLDDIGGTSPLRLTINTGGGTRDLSSNEVARIIMAKPDNVAAAPAAAASSVVTTTPVSGAITVAANQGWVSTGISVRKGQRLSFTTTGNVQLSGDANDVANADGSKSARYAPNAQMRNVLAGALIGKIGNGQPFAIGNQPVIVAPGAGVLMLSVNDDSFGDNVGNFQVIVR